MTATSLGDRRRGAGFVIRRASSGLVSALTLRGLLQRRPLLILLALMLILFVSGLATGFDLAVRLNYILGLVVVVAYIWAKWGTGRLSAEIERPRGDLSVGDELRETITIRNTGGPPRAWLEVEDVTDIPGVSLGRVVSMPGIVTFRRVDASVRLTRRGDYTLGPLVIRSSDPFGIFPQEKRLADARPLKVYPQILDIPDYVIPSAELSGEHARRRRSPTLSPEVSSVREYQPGDAISRIHWPSTARTSQLMVKLFDRGRAGEVWIVFDQHHRYQAGEGGESTDEYGATIAASTAHRYLAIQIPVGYVAHGGRSLTMVPERGAAQRHAIFDHLASSKPTGSRQLFDALADVERELGRSSSVVVITASPDGEWVDALTNFQRRGIHTSTVLLDPASFGADWSIDGARKRLLASGSRVFTVRRGASIPAALSEPEVIGPRAANGRRPDKETRR